MRGVLGTRAPASFARFSTASDWCQCARRSRTEGVSRSTVSTLCANTSSPEVATRSTSTMLPLKSGESTSTSNSGERAFISLTTCAMWLLPWSGRSSRSTEVMTMYPTPQLFTASAVFSGSRGSNGGGALLVFTAQNLHPRVHVSPMTMMVAVAMWPSPPDQHSPIFGHFASSQTVDSFRSRSCFLIAVYSSPAGTTFFSQSGFRILSFGKGAYTAYSLSPLTKSSKSGPSASRSRSPASAELLELDDAALLNTVVERRRDPIPRVIKALSAIG
mmetsp:Transcript_32818/g.71587  ORF Transcript_32818/g.71587 Transcript_32818/m.71587 type:complete len:274 (+) Transcript_32818:1-822(+)